MVNKEQEFIISADAVPGLNDIKIGQTFKGIINYQIVEITKSYSMIRIKYLNPDYGKRKF